MPVWTAIGFHNSDLHKIISYRYWPFFMNDHFSPQSLFTTTFSTATFWYGYFSLTRWMNWNSKRPYQSWECYLWSTSNCNQPIMCQPNRRQKKTGKWVFIPFYIPLTKIQFDEISKLEFKKSKLCLQSKKGKPAS